MIFCRQNHHAYFVTWSVLKKEQDVKKFCATIHKIINYKSLSGVWVDPGCHESFSDPAKCLPQAHQ
jgi:hypothetical protein